MIALSASRTRSLLGWIFETTVCDSELSMLQSNQKAPEEITSLGDLDVQQTNPKTFITYLAAKGPRAKLEY